MTRPVTIGVSLKMYFDHSRTRIWATCIREICLAAPAVASGSVEVIVIPSYLAVSPLVDLFAGTGVLVGAQDVSGELSGPYTGEVSARELAEVGARVAEMGHAERRRLYGETDATTAAKAAAALAAGLVPLICVGEAHRTTPALAADAVVAQLRASLDGAPEGRIIVAYEPVWAIGAAEPAAAHHVDEVVGALRRMLDELPGRSGSSVIYGGSAGPGAFDGFGRDLNGLFLGRFAHDPEAFRRVLDEAAARAETQEHAA